MTATDDAVAGRRRWGARHGGGHGGHGWRGGGAVALAPRAWWSVASVFSVLGERRAWAAG